MFALGVVVFVVAVAVVVVVADAVVVVVAGGAAVPVVVAVAAVDGTVNLRRLIKNPSGRLEIQREFFYQINILN